MKAAPINRKQFVWWFIAFTIAMALWMSPAFSGLGAGMLPFINLLLMSKDERSRPVPTRVMIFGLLGSIVLIALIIVSKRWLPKDTDGSLERVIHHPALVIGFWGLMVWLVYRRYKLARNLEAEVA